MRQIRRCESKMAALYRLIPSYPNEVSRLELARKMKVTSNDIAMMIERFRAYDPICEDDYKLCYISPAERKKFLNAINIAERRANERKQQEVQ